MADKKFVVAIGGTGMRCLESFVHLCAIGMFDNEEIDILTLDTDQTNGNKGRVEQLIDTYNHIKSNDSANIDGGTPNADTFFSAKLNLYKFFTDYSTSERSTYANLAQLSQGDKQAQADNQALSDLFLDKNTVQDFKLDHGYRAQTHLGSYLMYNGIVEAARKIRSGSDNLKDEEKSFGAFLLKLLKESSNARVFVFGSVFGGTGASSIPIIPVAFRDAISILDGHSTLDLKKVNFGATLLTEYFKFHKPSQTDRKREHIIADSDFFAINSQAALQFYQGDPTVKMCYRRLYHVGWPLQSKALTDNDTTTETGGANQKNNCHVVELLCACAAYDFFKQDEAQMSNAKANYLYRSAPYDGSNFSFSGADFVGTDVEKFETKFGAFFSFAHILLGRQGGSTNSLGTKGLAERLCEHKIEVYKDIKLDQLKELDKYFQMFGYQFENDGTLTLGWIYQIYHSIQPGSFIFKSSAFETKNIKEVDPGDLFEDKRHQWDKSFIHSRYDTFIKGLTNNTNAYPKPSQKANTLKEKFLAHMYNAIMLAQKS
mgnify:CR=1 FL=1